MCYLCEYVNTQKKYQNWRKDKMKILVACEESQSVTIQLRKLGHEAYSCDIQNPSGGHNEWHIKCDALELLKIKWDMIIAFPPCTYLTITGNRWFNEEKYGKKAIERKQKREEAAKFFLSFANANCPKIAIENPIGYMNTHFRKPDQIVHPYYFSKFQDDENCERKATCLWLNGLPPLKYNIRFNPRIITYKNGKTDSAWHVNTISLPKEERSKQRSKTYPGIAEAMAEQWAGKI